MDKDTKGSVLILIGVICTIIGGISIFAAMHLAQNGKDYVAFILYTPVMIIVIAVIVKVLIDKK
jgi:uncharacterized membrane protein YidH (DUF202 family)